jgi:ABC-type sugar transport system ATPase subunit
MLLELRNVDVVFDGIIQVLRSVNLDVRAGKVTASPVKNSEAIEPSP